MIQQQTILKASDNSGAKLVRCIKVLGGFKKKTANIGDIIVVSVIKLRNKSKKTAKVKKGEVFKALVTRTKSKKSKVNGFSVWFDSNSASLLTKQNKPIGSRILGPLPSCLKYGKFSKIVSTSYGGIV